MAKKKILNPFQSSVPKEDPFKKIAEEKNTITQIPEPKQTQPSIIRDEETNRISGVKFPDGKVILASPREVRGLIENENKLTELPRGAVEESDLAKEREQIAQQNENLKFQAQEREKLKAEILKAPNEPKEEKGFFEKSPQEVFNPDGSLGGAIKATAGVVAGVGLLATLPELAAAQAGRTAITSGIASGFKSLKSVKGLLGVGTITNIFFRGRVSEAISIKNNALQGMERIEKQMAIDPTYTYAQARIDFQKYETQIIQANQTLKNATRGVKNAFNWLNAKDDLIEMQDILDNEVPLRKTQLLNTEVARRNGAKSIN